MQRIDTATKYTDLFGSGKHGFRDGNKASGIAATQLNAVLFNNVQEEIVRVIEAAGITLDGTVLNQLLLSLRATGVFTTPAQFDNTTKAATTAFVQKALGNVSGFYLLNASATLTLAQLGNHVQLAQTTPSGQIFTLPALATLANSGSGYWVTNDSPYAQTIKANASENINPITANSFTLLPKETVFVMSQGSTQWNIFGAISALVFQSSLAAAGYQKLPSGLIVQWGVATSSGSGFSNLTFPLAWPTGMYTITGSVNNATTNTFVASFNGGGLTTSLIPFAVTTTANAYSGQQVYWSAIGH